MFIDTMCFETLFFRVIDFSCLFELSFCIKCLDTLLTKIDDQFGAVVRILGNYARSRGFDPRTDICVHEHV
jgi:hypothetical protein